MGIILHHGAVAWWNRRKRRADGRPSGKADPAVVRHLTEFARARRGVEAFVEQPTTLSQASLLLVAHDGEWTRRRVPSVAWGHKFAEHLGLPSYDAGVMGYPQRMRDWNRRQHKPKA